MIILSIVLIIVGIGMTAWAKYELYKCQYGNIKREAGRTIIRG